MADGEYESVSVEPVGVLRIVAQVAMKEHVSDGRERHRRTGMTGVGLLNRVHGKNADRVDC